MKNRERYGKGKSWRVRIQEDGLSICCIDADAYAWKEGVNVTITTFQEAAHSDIGDFLVELGQSVKRLADGEIKPEWMAADGDMIEPGDEDWPF